MNFATKTLSTMTGPTYTTTVVRATCLHVQTAAWTNEMTVGIAVAKQLGIDAVAGMNSGKEIPSADAWRRWELTFTTLTPAPTPETVPVLEAAKPARSRRVSRAVASAAIAAASILHLS